MKDEEALFREAMDGVAPLGDPRAKHQRKIELTAGQLQRRHDAVNDKRDEADPNYFDLTEVHAVHPLEVLEWKKDGVQRQVFQKLKTGKYPVEGLLDLHGKTVKEAREEIFKFLQLCQRKGWRSVIVAHGRGEHSATPARIKSYVARWMRQAIDVIAFHSAPRHIGGTGALFVLLRKSDAQREENRERHGLKSEPVDEPRR